MTCLLYTSGLTRHHTRLGKVLLRHTEPLALYPNTGADSSALHGPSLISELPAFTVTKKRWLVCQKSFTSEKYATRQTPIDKIGVRDHRRNCLVPYSAPGKPLPAPRLGRLRASS